MVLMEWLRRYPIYPGSCLFLYTVYLFPVTLLLVVLQRSALQSNCRIILTTWALGMVGILTNEIYLMYVNMHLADGEFISKSLQEPANRPHITVIHSIFYICMSALEFLVALERTYAARSAASAEEPRSILWFLIPYLAVWSWIAWYTATLAFVEFNMLVICITFISVEISSILINFAIFLYCKRRYVTMFGRSSLTERYQFSAALVSWIYAFYYEQIPYFVLEGIYQTLHASSCAGSAIMLMKGHPRLKREALRILKKCYPSIQITDNTPRMEADGQQYFQMLSKSWSIDSNSHTD